MKLELKQLVIRADDKRLRYLIDEVCEDIVEYQNKNEPIALFLIDGQVEDYDVIRDNKIIKYSDEEVIESTLVYFLFHLISAYEKTKLGAYLKANRAGEDLTLKALAEKVGVDIRTIQKWEAEERLPDSKNMFALIRELKLDPQVVEMILKK